MSDQEMRIYIKNKLIQCRIESGLTQKEVGEIVKKSPTAVASWEQGLSLPDIETLYRLTTYYGKTLDYMVGVKNEH